MNTINDPIYIRMVDNLRVRRLTLGLDQATVVARLGYIDRWLLKVEHRDLRLDISTFMRLCHALGLRAHRLVREGEEGLDGSGSLPYLWQRVRPE